MSRMFTPEPSLSGAPNASIPETEPQSIESGDYEFVLGKRQFASLSLVSLTLLGTCSAGAYMIGKSTVPTPPAPIQIVQPKPIEIIAPEPVEPAKVAIPEDNSSVFGVPEKNARYLQLGSVERGFAIMMVQGARKQGYPAIVGAGTNPNVYRVLVGPLPDKEQYQAAKTMFTSIGLDPFTRTYGGDSKETETPEP